MAVDEGLNNAQYLYGRYCIEGQYVKKNISLGISYIQKAAKQNNVEALAYLGDAYYLGLQGFKKDSVESVRWYEKSAKRGFFKAQYRVGNFYFNANDTTSAVNYWQMLINNKKAEKPKLMTAQERRMLGETYYNLGTLYYNKQLYSLDKETDLNFFDKAANCGYDYAAYLLSQIYHETCLRMNACRAIMQKCLPYWATWMHRRCMAVTACRAMAWRETRLKQ